MSTSAHAKMFRAVSSFSSQSIKCHDEFERALTNLNPLLKSEIKFSRIVICAMGGSAFPMEILRVWLKDELTLTLHRDYPSRLPVNKPDTLYLLISFSGNTEEVLACAEDLLTQGASLCAISSGGKLTDWCKDNHVPLIGFPSLPADFQPRCAGGYFLGFVGRLLDALGVTRSLTAELEDGFARLESKRSSVEAEGVRLAQFFEKGERWILGYPCLAETVGRIGRIKLNENAKLIVHYDNLPEFNHNQMVAAVSDESKRVQFLFLEQDGLAAQERHRLETCKAFMVTQGFECASLSCHGDTLLEQMLYGVWVLDFASLRLAAKKGIDPLEIASIESFKIQLKESKG
ncbi:MAG: SIS domain-containing protein [Bradymonadia bacterium]